MAFAASGVGYINSCPLTFLLTCLQLGSRETGWLEFPYQYLGAHAMICYLPRDLSFMVLELLDPQCFPVAWHRKLHGIQAFAPDLGTV
jgi:hypothetical protein